MIVMTTKNTRTGEVVGTETFQDFDFLREDLFSTATAEYAHTVLSAFEQGATTVSVQNGRHTADTYTVE
jgi:hypothetical protein